MSILKIKYLFFFILIIFGCSSPLSVKSRHQLYSAVPEYIVAKSDSIIISKTGIDLFKKYFNRINHDLPENSIDWDLHPAKAAVKQYDFNAPYNVLYIFRIPGKKWINEPIRFCFDSVGNLINRLPHGIPEFLLYPDSYTFSIDSITAINIAKQAGFQEGNDGWKVGFGFTRQKNIEKYTWAIKNCLSLHCWCAAHGQIILIDASSGAILGKAEWVCQY